ncbi:MAG: extracellular solute-binding protein [Fimbriimonas sp.]
MVSVVLVLAGSCLAHGQVVLRYACMDTGDSLRMQQKLAAEFEKANPGIKVQVESIPDEYIQKLLTQAAARVAPDLAQLSVNHYQRFATRGALWSIDELRKDDPGPKLDDWYPNVLQYYTWEGKLWALPRDVGPFGLIFYNKRAFREAGIPYPDGNWSWTEGVRPELREKDFIWVMRELTRRGPDGKVVQFGLAPEWPQLWFNLLLQSRGYQLWDSNEAPKRITANQPETVQLMEFARNTIVKDNWIPTWDQITTVRQSSVFDEFRKGRIAMYITFPNYLERLRREIPPDSFDWDVTLFPAYEGRERAFGTDATGTVVMKGTRHPREAWKLAQWMAGAPAQRSLAISGMAQPANRKLALEPGVWLYGPGLPEARKTPQHLDVTDIAASQMSFSQTPEYFEDTLTNLDSAAFDILSGTRPVKETLDRVTAESQVRLDSALRRLPRDPFPQVWGWVFGVAVALGLLAWIYWPERSVRLTRTQKQDARAAYLFLTPLLIGLVGFTLGPMLYSLVLSTTNSDILRPPLWRGAQNYVDAFTVDPLFWQSVKVTLVYTALSTPIGIAFALGLALLLNVKVKGMPIYRSLYYLPSLVSGVATSLIWMRLFHPENGLINRILYGPDGKGDLLGLGTLMSNLAGTPGQPVNWLGSEHTVLPAFVLMGLWGAGGGTILFLAGLQGISKSYYEAAQLDGAGVLRQFRNITFPLLTPTLFFSLITGLIGSFQVFTQAFVMTQGGPNNATQFYMLNLYTQAFRSLKMGYACALAWILFAIILAITWAQFATSRRWVYYEGEGR